MAIYELRTYGIYVGKMAEALELYRTQGWPAVFMVSRHPGSR